MADAHVLAGAGADAAAQLAERFRAVRARTLSLVDGLSAEDLSAQSMPDASPGKWHLAHTSWFFEVMLLQPHAGLAPLHPDWLPLFNSYYEALGARHARPERGLLTRPALAEVMAYRAEVEERLLRWLEESPSAQALALLELGLQHEQQHQELLVTDLKHLFSRSPLQPAWRAAPAPAAAGDVPVLGWIEHANEGPAQVGAPDTGFAYDNERPRHTRWLRPFALADRPVSCGEYLAFVDSDGYAQPHWWLADGIAAVQAGNWRAPLYWERRSDGWWRFTVHGPRPLQASEPVSHLSWYEAEAYARFVGARLPTEAEWETVAARHQWTGGFAGAGPGEPRPMRGPLPGGEVWEWTASAYAPYPGFRPLAGAAGEYNGKFMSGQMVLRGGSCATPRDHARPSYRNFFPPAARWQFSGLRLARDLS
jgi:ergothioneine biosynthesis protein EgtB